MSLTRPRVTLTLTARMRKEAQEIQEDYEPKDEDEATPWMESHLPLEEKARPPCFPLEMRKGSKVCLKLVLLKNKRRGTWGPPTWSWGGCGGPGRALLFGLAEEGLLCWNPKPYLYQEGNATERNG